MKQLALPFLQDQSFAAEDFCTAPSNAMAREWLAKPKTWSNGRLVLWGEAGCGKTHLLHIWAVNHGALWLDGPELRGLVRPEQPVVIDDVDVALEPRAVLHVLNAAAEAEWPVAMAARQSPARQPIKLADLASRLRASQAAEIRAPEDELLACLLTRFAAARQLNLSIAVRNVLLTQLPRTAAALAEAVARLDHATLHSGEKVTRQLAVSLLEDIIAGV